MIQDLDLMIGHYAQTGILSSVDLGEYHWRFILISWYLIGKGAYPHKNSPDHSSRDYNPNWRLRSDSAYSRNSLITSLTIHMTCQ
jgi:hypothetical protein